MRTILEAPNPVFPALAAFALVSPVSIAATNAAWVAALLLWGAKRFSERRLSLEGFPRTEMDTAFGVFALASFLSLWTSLDLWESLVEFRSLGLMVVFFLFAWNVRNGGERRRLVHYLLGAASVAALFGIVQYTTGWDYTGYYDPVIRRAGSFFGLHLTFGEYLVLAGAVAGGLLLFGRPAAGPRTAGWILVLLMTAGVVVSGSKGAFLGLLTAAMVLLLLKCRSLPAAACAAAAVVLLLFCFVAFSHNPISRAVVSQFYVDASRKVGCMDSNTQRVYMWWSGLRISAGHLLQGVGLHAVGVLYPSFRHPLATQANQWHLHNQYVQIGVTRGLFGLAGMLYVLLAGFRAAFRRFRGRGDPWDRGLAAGMVAGLAGFCTYGLTEYCWGDSEVLMLLYMLLGLTVSIPAPPDPGTVARAGTSTAPGRDPTGWSGSAAPRPPILPSHPISPAALLPIVLAGVLALSFLLPPAHGSVRERILQAGLGGLLSILLLRSPGAGTAGSTTVRGTIAAIAALAWYAFTRSAWTAAEQTFASPPLTGPYLAMLLLSVPLLAALVGWHVRRRADLTLFDLSVGAACLLWIITCVGTNLLLAVAAASRQVLLPPTTVLVPLVSALWALYALVRFLYEGRPLERALGAGLACAMVLHALRG